MQQSWQGLYYSIQVLLVHVFTCSCIHDAVITLPPGDVLTTIHMDDILPMTKPRYVTREAFSRHLFKQQAIWLVLSLMQVTPLMVVWVEIPLLGWYRLHAHHLIQGWLINHLCQHDGHNNLMLTVDPSDSNTLSANTSGHGCPITTTDKTLFINTPQAEPLKISSSLQPDSVDTCMLAGAKNMSTAAKWPSKMHPSNALTARYILPLQMSILSFFS